MGDRSDDSNPPDPQPARRALLERHPFFAAAAPETLDRLAGQAIVKTYADREPVFHKGDEGDGLYGVLDGGIRITSSGPDGRFLVLNTIGTQEIFGEIALLDDDVRTADATAIGPTRLLHIPKARFRAHLEQDRGLCIALLGLLCRRMRRTNSMVEDLALLDLQERLAKCVLDLAGATDGAAGGPLEVTATQQEIAEHLGVSRETVNRELAKWRASGLVETRLGRLVIKDPARLARIAGIPGD